MVFTRAVTILGMTLLAAVLGACSSGPDGATLPVDVTASDGRFGGLHSERPIVDPNDPYAREFDEWIAESDSEFVKQVLKDHKITEAEFGEAQDRFEKCLNGAGIETTRVSVPNAPSTVTQIATVGDFGDNPAFSTCGSQWIDGLDMYSTILYNPENVYWFELIARCLVENNVVPKGLTAVDVEEANSKAGYWNEDGKEYPPLDINPTLPGGAKWLDPMVEKCVANPLHPESVELYVP